MAEHLKLPEVARRLDVSEKTARRYIKSGALPSVFIGGAYRVSEEDLEAFLQAAKVTPGGGSPKGSAPTSRQQSFNDVLDERRSSRFAEALFATADKCVGTMTAPSTDPSTAAGMVDALLTLHESVMAPMNDDQSLPALTHEEGEEILAVARRLIEAASAGVQRLEEGAEDAGEERDAKRRREQIREMTRRISA